MICGRCQQRFLKSSETRYYSEDKDQQGYHFERSGVDADLGGLVSLRNEGAKCASNAKNEVIKFLGRVTPSRT